MSLANIPPAEMELMRYILEHHPISVRGVADHMATTKGYTRTTVLNLMERLRKRGYLARVKQEGVFRYSPTVARPAILAQQVRSFVAQSLGGSLEPFMVYLSEGSAINDDDLDELMQIVADLDARRNRNMESKGDEQ